MAKCGKGGDIARRLRTDTNREWREGGRDSKRNWKCELGNGKRLNSVSTPLHCFILCPVASGVTGTHGQKTL